MTLLSVRELSLSYLGGQPVLDRVSFELARGEALGVVGESGAGKTQMALALMGLSAKNARLDGSICFDGTDLCGASESTLNEFRARRMAIVFQDPLRALNPYLRVGRQLTEILDAHGLAAGAAARNRAVELLRQVGLPDAERQMRAYPHQLSGGMRQRVMLASALIARPELLIADEPTTALDVTVQAQILALLGRLRAHYGLALLLISHDLAVIAGNCERTLVLHGGCVVEQADTATLFRAPRHERTRAMLAAIPAIKYIEGPAVAARQEPLLVVRDVSVVHDDRRAGRPWRGAGTPAVRHASFELAAGETLALVGESGSGKTSLMHALLGLLPAASGEVIFRGRKLERSVTHRPPRLRRELQLVFQDPAGSLNPAMRVRDIVAEPLSAHERTAPARDRNETVIAMLHRVGLDAQVAAKFPNELSGGQVQRVALARSLILRPRLLVLDEAVSALDGEIRNEILALLKKEQAESGLSILFIAHDLGVVKAIAHRILVMYLGRICEAAPAFSLFARPRHPYTRALLDSVPVPDPTRVREQPPVTGEVPSPRKPPGGCAFHPRCPFAIEQCRQEQPGLVAIDAGSAACHRAAELNLGSQLPAA